MIAANTTACKVYWLIACVLIAVNVESSETKKAETNSQATTVNFKKNVRQTLEQMKCSKPQKRLVYLEDEYKGYQPQVMYFPQAALLHRCDKSTGCCAKPHEICSPAETRNVTHVFQQIALSGKKSIVKVNMIDHITCECQSNAWDAPR